MRPLGGIVPLRTRARDDIRSVKSPTDIGFFERDSRRQKAGVEFIHKMAAAGVRPAKRGKRTK